MRKIIITGGTGLLGKYLIGSAEKEDIVVATYLGEYEVKSLGNISYLKLDVLDREGYSRLFEEFRPNVVIHTASIGSPDYAEKFKEMTWKINVESTRHIVSLCERYNSSVVFISSNGIYDGNNAPYGEDDEAKPVNYYGETKLEGELIAKKAKVNSAIVRPILMYGWNNPFERGNIVTTALSQLKNNKRVAIYDDVYCNPLYAGNCAKAIWSIVNRDKYDVFNVAGGEIVNIYGLIRKAAEIFGLDTALIDPVKQGYFNELVPRPKDTSYKTKKMRELLGIVPETITQGLNNMKKEQK